MRWSTTLGIVIFLVFAASLKGVLAFSFCAIVSFVFSRSLLNGEHSLDFTRYFASKAGLGSSKEQRALLRDTAKQFPRGLKTRRHTLIRNILRDFVISWYENVAIGGDFILETRSLLEEATVVFYDKLAKTTVSSHTEKLCVVLHKHLATVEAVKLTIPKNHKDFVEKYHSLQQEGQTYKSHELQYLRNITDLLLYKLIKPKTFNCDAGRFILREILAVKLLLPLLDTISDPNFLNASIINIFGENTDENQLATTPSELVDGGSCNLKVSTSFMDFLDERFESDGHDRKRKSSQSESSMTYQFKGSIVVEKDHSELVEISMKQYLPEKNSVLSENNATQSSKTSPETVDKTSDSSLPKRIKHTVKEFSQSGMLNGLNKIKNDILKPYKEKGPQVKHSDSLSARINPGGAMIARQIRKMYSSPIIRIQTGKDLDEPVEADKNTTKTVSDADDLDFSHKESEISDSHCQTASLNFDRPETRSDDADHRHSPPKTVGTDSMSSSYEDIDFLSSDRKPEGIDSSDGIFESRETGTRRHMASFSSTDEWDSELFEKTDDGLAINAGAGFIEEDAVSILPDQFGDDTISTANFAIHDLPNPCSMINIPSTQIMTDHSFEPYKSQYTVYIIVYNKHLVMSPESDEHPVDIESSEADMLGSIKRRYREFMELHHRLVCGPLASLMKDIPKPNRKFNSPFFRLDQDVVEGRQILLESYLKCLVTKPAILHGDDFKGFLGIGDESHMDFRRHISVVPSLPNVPRIDKKLQKKVTKIIDHIKTAFDTGPVDGDKEEEYDDIRKVLGEDKSSQDDIRTFAICSKDCKLNHSCCYSERCYTSFIQHQQDNPNQSTTENPALDHRQPKSTPVIRQDPSRKISPRNGHAIQDVKSRKDLSNSGGKIPVKRNFTVLRNDMSESPCSNKGQENNPLTKSVLNLSCHLFEKHNSWVCLEPVQESATTVFGCFLEWWMESLLSELVTEEQWQYYLTLLTDTVWPRGELMNATKEEISDEEKLKTKEDAIQTLSNFFGGNKKGWLFSNASTCNRPYA
ncbi:sorting nexin-19-like [Dendronephthya gigantea]|uniref:sorting nexin-19-like n=1 Tax=Dendronephthya gigantea TaxID=151771 RepID=UPI00106AEB61|nr:sorting nexin-19-like [Dendronephthya gigantea]